MSRILLSKAAQRLAALHLRLDCANHLDCLYNIFNEDADGRHLLTLIVDRFGLVNEVVVQKLEEAYV